METAARGGGEHGAADALPGLQRLLSHWWRWMKPRGAGPGQRSPLSTPGVFLRASLLSPAWRVAQPWACACRHGAPALVPQLNVYPVSYEAVNTWHHTGWEEAAAALPAGKGGSTAHGLRRGSWQMEVRKSKSLASRGSCGWRSAAVAGWKCCGGVGKTAGGKAGLRRNA